MKVNNLGAARIRIRSLKAAIDERDKNNFKPVKENMVARRIIFTKEMRENSYYFSTTNVSNTFSIFRRSF